MALPRIINVNQGKSMDWKVIWRKIVKGAVSGLGVGIGVLSSTGIPVTEHGVAVLLGAVGSAVLHGVANVFEQTK